MFYVASSDPCVYNRPHTDRFRQAERYLQRVGAATRRAGGEETTIGANIQRSLAKRLQELSGEFRQSQRKYLAEVRAQKSGGNPADAAKFGGLDFTSEGDFFSGGTQQLAVVLASPMSSSAKPALLESVFTALRS